MPAPSFVLVIPWISIKRAEFFWPSGVRKVSSWPSGALAYACTRIYACTRTRLLFYRCPSFNHFD